MIRDLVKKIPYARNFYRRTKQVNTLIKSIQYRAALTIGAGFETQVTLLFKAHCQEIIKFNPEEVNHCIKRDQKLKSDKFCIDGDWDQVGVAPIEEERKIIADTIQELFIEGIPAKNTSQYQYMKKRLENGEKAYWCKNVDDIDVYFDILLETYKKIKTEGFKTQDELAKETPEIVNPRKNDEIQLYITRNGELVLGGGGTHRLLIAKLLGLKYIPGLIKGVHKEWARRSYEYYNGKKLETSIKKAICSNWDIYR